MDNWLGDGAIVTGIVGGTITIIVGVVKLALWMIRKKVDGIDENRGDIKKEVENRQRNEGKILDRLDHLHEKQLLQSDHLRKVDGSLEKGQTRFDGMEQKLALLASTAMTKDVCQLQHTEHKKEHARLDRQLDTISNTQAEQKTMLAGIHGQVDTGFKTLTAMNGKIMDMLLERHEKERDPQ